MVREKERLSTVSMCIYLPENIGQNTVTLEHGDRYERKKHSAFVTQLGECDTAW